MREQYYNNKLLQYNNSVSQNDMNNTARTTALPPSVRLARPYRQPDCGPFAAKTFLRLTDRQHFRSCSLHPHFRNCNRGEKPANHSAAVQKENVPMKKILVALALVAAGTTAALAGPIEDRQGVMKELQSVMKSGLPISQGKQPFDAAAHKTMMDPLVAGAEKFPTQFPAGTGPGNGTKTQSTAAVWSDAAGFKALNVKFVADVKALAAAKDQAGFAAGFKALQSGCAGCHKVYRGPAS